MKLFAFIKRHFIPSKELVLHTSIFSILFVSLFTISDIGRNNLYENSISIFAISVLISISNIYIILKLEKKKSIVLGLIFQFLTLILLFSSVYSYYYCKNANNFYVANSIQTGKVFNDYDKEFEKLTNTNKKLILISELQEYSQRTLSSILNYRNEPKKVYPLKNGFSYYFYVHTTPLAPAGSSTTYKLVFIKPKTETIELNGTEFTSWAELGDDIIGSLLGLKTEEQVYNHLDFIIKKLKLKQKEHKEELNKFVTFHSSLCYLDFLYFSTITITTTGYGDIIPNSTTVRTIVLLQTILGVLFIAFGLTILTKE